MAFVLQETGNEHKDFTCLQVTERTGLGLPNVGGRFRTTGISPKLPSKVWGGGGHRCSGQVFLPWGERWVTGTGLKLSLWALLACTEWPLHSRFLLGWLSKYTLNLDFQKVPHKLESSCFYFNNNNNEFSKADIWVNFWYNDTLLNRTFISGCVKSSSERKSLEPWVTFPYVLELKSLRNISKMILTYSREQK